MTYRREDIENQLKNSGDQFIHVLDNLNSAISVVDMDTYELLFVNKTFARYFGKCTSDLMGRICWDVFFENKKTPCRYCTNGKMVDKNGQPTGLHVRDFENRYLNRVFEITDQAIQWSDGRLVKLSVATDITERKLREKEKVDALKFSFDQGKYALVGQVAGKMAHDFNNILGAIMGNAEISLLDCREEETIENLQIILEQTIRGKNLTRNLVAFAKDQEIKEEYFNIHSMINLVIHLLDKDLDDTVVVRNFNSDLPELLADPGMIEHALVNLVQNAIHAMSLVKKPELTIKTYVRSKNLFVEIIDNGCGIPDEYHEDIYSPSFTLKGSRDFTGAYRVGIKGTGYGLSNVKKYIEKHKGSICFESKTNQGTKFIISVPIIKKDLTKNEKRLVLQKKVIKGRRILLVEDEPSISKVQYKILSSEPFCHKITIAQTGEIAMDEYDNGEFDLISLDYLLPGNFNGFDIYRHIRTKDKNLPIIFVSGNFAFLESIKELLKTDKNMDYVSKPCENIVYATTINKWLQKQSS
ncbi:ATP-binding protein [Desulfobacula toluolica]|uniref:histidine kinase n=1 Tax=Desulfobacula toluolica (strain DSM 7467 / Tol2) TaxID=651182 RepID=K0NDU9_DESTT|nr:ATP-binding protein [Desulfobacula toluolica]CCK79066.1 two component system sensor histidine kinase [Desulfobacula toluolica Tol2]